MNYCKFIIAIGHLFIVSHIYAQPCQLTCPSNITVDATSPAGALVNYPSPGVSGTCGVVHFIPGSGNTFPIGTTTVNVINNPVQTIYGLTPTGLVSFNASTPGTVSAPITITGLAAGEQIQSIDFRTATGQLYGLAVSAAGTLGRLYVINTTTGVATAVGISSFSLPGVGSYSIDFNPVVDRIRLVSNAGLNVRISPDLGTVVATDAPLNPGTPSITDIAYSNSFPLSTTTTLYDIDSQSDALYTQNGNGGVLTLVGPLGIDATLSSGFDVGPLGFAYAQISSGAGALLYTINLGTGAATLVGSIGNASVVDIAAAPITQGEAQCSFTVTVNPLPVCQLTCPSNITVDATSPAGTVVNFPSAITSGTCTNIVTIPQSGSTFPIGTTTVNLYNNPVQMIYALTNTNQLVSFNAISPGTVSASIPITGLSVGEQIQSIDFRISNGQLYGLAVSAAGTAGRLYVINTTTGVATAVGVSTFILPGVGTFSIDFNPVVDRIRLVSSAGLNLRLNPDLGTVVTDTPLNPGAPAIADIAYTNNPLSTTTTLYDIDFQTDALYIQNPANAGTLTLVGPLGVNAVTSSVGFDISQTGTAFAELNNGVAPVLYTINLATGAATFAGTIANFDVVDIAVAPISQGQAQCSFTVTVNGCTLTCPPNISVDATSPGGAVVNYPVGASAACSVVYYFPGPGSTFPVGTTTVHVVNNPVQTIYGLTAISQLVSFNASTPGITSSPLTIAGLAAGEQIRTIDFRPSTGQLYGLAVNAAATLGRLYVINTSTGVATAVGASAFALPGVGIFSIDFNPVVDRIRLVSSAGLNLRLNPDLGTISVIDAPLNPGTPAIADIAYSNSVPLSTSTNLYDIDFTSDALYTQNPANSGLLNLVGTLGVDVTNLAGFDISQFEIAYAQINDGITASFYTLNLATGAATLVGALGNTAVVDIAAAPITQGQAQCSFTVTVNSACSTVYYKDSDNDGYGDPAVTTTGCTPPAGYVTDKTDCNDNDNTIHPGAAEICDGKDNDCDGQTDENCTWPPCPDCDDACTYTQGFYGNVKGTACFNNTSTASTTQLMLNAFGADVSKVFGNVANKRFFTLYKTDIQNKNIFKMLPGSGSSKAIAIDAIAPYDGAYYDNQQTWYLVPIPTSGSLKGKINNMLLAQTITLWFNLRTSSSLGGINLAKDTLVTAAQTSCGSGIATGLPVKFGLPHDVVVYLNGGNGYSNDVNGLFQLANDVLGGVVTIVDAAHMQEAVATINLAFDGCRILIKTIDYVPVASPITSKDNRKEITEALTTGIAIKASPNPSGNRFVINVSSVNSAAKISLQVYDMQGRLIEEKNIPANSNISLGHQYIPGMYIVNARQGNEQTQIKLIKTGN